MAGSKGLSRAPICNTPYSGSLNNVIVALRAKNTRGLNAAMPLSEAAAIRPECCSCR